MLKIDSAGSVIRRLRIEKAMSLTDLAIASNMDKGYLSKLETNKQGLNQTAIDRVSSGLGISPVLLTSLCLKEVYPALQGVGPVAEAMDQLIESLKEN